MCALFHHLNIRIRHKNILKRTNIRKFLIYFGQITELFQRKKAGEKDMVINRASACSSVTISDRHVLSQYYLVKMLGGAGATCALDKGIVLKQLCS